MVSGKQVKAAIVEPFYTATEKLLTDGAKAIASCVTAMSGARRTFTECQAVVADQISSYIRMMKAEGLQVLRKMK